MHPKKSSIVRQSNKLVEARYSLTLNEQRVILSLISLIHPKDKDFQYYELDITQLAKLMEVDPKHAIRDVENVIFRVQDRVIFIRESDGKNYFRTHWLSAVKKVGNKIQLRFDPDLKPYLLQLKEQFTQFKLGAVVQFQSAYTIRLYALLKQYESIGVRKFEVEKLRETLGIEKGKYSQFKEFKRWVLNQAKKEFEERDKKTGEYKSDISFDLETQREGRLIKYLIFHIKQHRVILKKDNEPQALEELSQEIELSFEPPHPAILKTEPPKTKTVLTAEQTEALSLLKENGVNETTAATLIKDFPPPRIIKNVKWARDKHNQRKTKDLGGLTVTAIREDWAQATPPVLEPPLQKSKRRKRIAAKDCPYCDERGMLELINRHNGSFDIRPCSHNLEEIKQLAFEKQAYIDSARAGYKDPLQWGSIDSKRFL